MFVDTHCHIDFDEFESDRDTLLSEVFDGRSNELSNEKNYDPLYKLSGLIVPGVCPSRWLGCLELANRYEKIYTSIGVHPWFLLNNSYRSTELFDLLVKNLNNLYCVAVGECGLDKTINTPLQVQQNVFAVHLEVAKALRLPLIVHATKAHNEVIQQIKSSYSLSGHGLSGRELSGDSLSGSGNSFLGIIHGFSGSYQLAKSYVDMGFYIGVGGTITYGRAQKTRDAISRLPLDSLVLETDAPNMPLCGRQGLRNSPEYLFAVAQVVADLHNVSLELVAEQTTKNASNVFDVNFS